MKKLVGCVFFALAACSTGTFDEGAATKRNYAEVADGVKVASKKAVKDVVVREDALIFPKKGNEDLLELERGSVLVGDRSTTGEESANPYGFARKVKSVTADEDQIVIETERAGLEDIFRNTHLSFELGGLPVEESADQNDPSDPGDQKDTDDASEEDDDDDNLAVESLRPRTESSSGGGGMSTTFSDVFIDTNMLSDGNTAARLQLAFTNLHVSATPHWTIDLEADSTNGLKKFAASAGLQFSGGGEYCGSISVETSQDIPLPILKKATYSLYDGIIGRPVTVMAGPVPVVFTGRGQLELACKIRAAGEGVLKGKVEISGNPTIKIGGDASDGAGEDASFKATGDVSFSTKASAGVRCEVVIKAGVYLYDTLGLYAALKPGIEASVSNETKTGSDEGTAATNCLNLTAETDLEYGFEARAFGKTLFQNYKQVNNIIHKPIEIIKSCNAKDSCVGRSAGWYCSDLVDYSAIQCGDDGAIQSGYQCADPTPNCQRTGPDRTSPAQTDGDHPLCGTTAPTKTTVEELKCPDHTAAPPTNPVGPCTDAKKAANGGFYCDKDDPHTIFDCSDGGQTQIACGDKYCRPLGGNYDNPSTVAGSWTPSCHDTVDSCDSARVAGWYCSPLTPSTAIFCPKGTSKGNPNLSPTKTAACDPGLRCQIDETSPWRIAKMDGDNPICAAAP